MFKNVMDTSDEIEGYCFVDEDAVEVRVSRPMIPWCSTLTVDISDSNGEDSLTIYHKDIPRLIMALEAAYNHKD